MGGDDEEVEMMEGLDPDVDFAELEIDVLDPTAQRDYAEEVIRSLLGEARLRLAASEVALRLMQHGLPDGEQVPEQVVHSVRMSRQTVTALEQIFTELDVDPLPPEVEIPDTIG